MTRLYTVRFNFQHTAVSKIGSCGRTLQQFEIWQSMEEYITHNQHEHLQAIKVNTKKKKKILKNHFNSEIP